jgi:hypothetical protein
MKHLNDTTADGLATSSIISFLATLSIATLMKNQKK